MSKHLRYVEMGVAGGMLLAVAAAAGLEGGTVRALGGPPLAFAALLGAAAAFTRGEQAPGRLARVGIVLLGIALLWQALPLPRALRAAVAPGQSAWLDRVAPAWRGDAGPWLEALATYDVDAALGLAGDWSYDVLAGASQVASFAGAVDRPDWVWTLGTLLAAAAVYRAGTTLGRSERGVLVVAVGMLLLGVAEALFGLANRNGSTTGIGAKVYYLGSATGTFVNRGHFGAFLLLAAGCTWGLAASLFPWFPEEIRKHARSRKRSSAPPSALEVGGSRTPRLVLLAFLAAVMTVALVASRARGPLVALIAVAAAVGGWTYWRRKEPWHLGIGLALPTSGVLLAALAFGPRGALGRFADVVGGDASVSSRLTIWREGLSAFLDAPVFGAGLGGWNAAHTLHERGAHLFSFTHAHDEPLEWLVEGGIVGFAGAAILVGLWISGMARRLRDAPQDLRTSVGIGASVGVGAVMLQSLGDFPLRVPGVLLPFALLAGLAWGAAGPHVPPVGVSARRAAPWVALAGIAAALLGASAVADRGFPGPREARVGEVPRVWYAGDAVRTEAEARAWAEDARDAVADAPLDPWVHAAIARAEARIAEAGYAKGGSRPVGDAPEDHAYAADLAMARALALRPRDPRLNLALARAMVRLASASPTPDAWRERATRRLAAAVALDPWRAEDAFALADSLPDAMLDRISGTTFADARSEARVRFEYGRALERRKRRDEALATHRAAFETDPTFGPPAFAAGAILRATGDEAGARALFERFLQARERPGGMEGWALVFLERYDAADARFRRVVAEAPKNRWAWEGLAEVAKHREDRRAEGTALRKILEIAPDDAAVRDRLTNLEKAAAR